MTNNTIFPPVIGNASLSCFQDLERTNFFFHSFLFLIWSNSFLSPNLTFSSACLFFSLHVVSLPSFRVNLALSLTSKLKWQSRFLFIMPTPLLSLSFDFIEKLESVSQNFAPHYVFSLALSLLLLRMTHWGENHFLLLSLPQAWNSDKIFEKDVLINL